MQDSMIERIDRFDLYPFFIGLELAIMDYWFDIYVIRIA
jgi:hypothetical protein